MTEEREGRGNYWAKVRGERDVVIASFSTVKEANDWLVRQTQGIQRECWIDDSELQDKEETHG